MKAKYILITAICLALALGTHPAGLASGKDDTLSAGKAGAYGPVQGRLGYYMELKADKTLWEIKVGREYGERIVSKPAPAGTVGRRVLANVENAAAGPGHALAVT
ncbi:MAG: hypothetical protein LBS18_07715, partial [Clostridiales bacterium]|nr:hypothetical protein [Clostridiales bacterium]